MCKLLPYCAIMYTYEYKCTYSPVINETADLIVQVSRSLPEWGGGGAMWAGLGAWVQTRLLGGGGGGVGLLECLQYHC